MLHNPVYVGGLSFGSAKLKLITDGVVDFVVRKLRIISGVLYVGLSFQGS